MIDIVLVTMVAVACSPGAPAPGTASIKEAPGTADDARALALWSETQHLVLQARDAEKTSFPEALTLYEQAQQRLDQVQEQYSSSQIAEDIRLGRARLGNDPATALSSVVIPAVRRKAAGSTDILACAYAVGASAPSDAPMPAFGALAKLLVQAGQRELARQILEEQHSREVASQDAFPGIELAIGYAALGDQITAEQLLARAYERTKGVAESSLVLGKIGLGYARINRFDEAQRLFLLAGRNYDFDRAKRFEQMVDIYLDLDVADEAVKLFHLMHIEPFMSGATSYVFPSLGAIAAHYARDGAYDQARAVVDLIPLEGYRAAALGQVGAAMVRNNQRDDGNQLLGEARALAEKEVNVDNKAAGLIEVAAAYIEAERQAEALEILNKALGVANKKHTPESIAYTKLDVAEKLIAAGQGMRAIELLDQLFIQSDSLRDTALGTGHWVMRSNIAVTAARAGDAKRMNNVMSEIPDSKEKALVLGEAAGLLARAGLGEDARKALSRALELAGAEEQPYERADNLVRIYEKYAAGGQPPVLDETARTSLHTIVSALP